MTQALQGKTALVTGAAAGIGEAIAREYVSQGARVLMVDLNEAAGKALAAELGDAVRFVAADVAARDSAARCVADCVQAFGRLDILVNNAGIILTRDVLELTVDEFEKVLSVNLTAGFAFAQAAARQMKAQGPGGVIINMSSVNALLAIPDQLPYAVSKGGVAQLTRVLSVALVPYGIRVNAIGPGTIGTELARNAVLSSPAARQKVMSRTPMGRLGEPSEVATVATFLASDAASYISGQTLYVDGGRLPLNTRLPVAD
ncbi:MAG: glucose 1-dehydrogenase [Burkholderiaceae bacterium]